jgi:hypothetical protein
MTSAVTNTIFLVVGDIGILYQSIKGGRDCLTGPFHDSKNCLLMAPLPRESMRRRLGMKRYVLDLYDDICKM